MQLFLIRLIKLFLLIVLFSFPQPSFGSSKTDCEALIDAQKLELRDRRLRDFLFSGPMLVGQNFVHSTQILNRITYQGITLPPGRVQLEIQETRIPYSNKISITLGLVTIPEAPVRLAARVDEIAPFNLVIDSDFKVSINSRGRQSPVTIRFPEADTMTLHSGDRTWVLGFSLRGQITSLEIIERPGDRKILMPLLHPTPQSTRRPAALFVRFGATRDWQNEVRKYISASRSQVLLRFFPDETSVDEQNEIASLLSMNPEEWESIRAGRSDRRILELWHVVVLARQLHIPIWDVIGFLADAPQTVRHPRLREQMNWLGANPKVPRGKQALKQSIGLRQADHFKSLFKLLGSEHKLHDLAIVLETDIDSVKKIVAGTKLIRLSQAVFLASYLGVDVRDLLAFLTEYENRK